MSYNDENPRGGGGSINPPCTVVGVFNLTSKCLNLTSHISCFSGCTVGSIVTMPTSGLLTRYDLDGGWPAVFYTFGKSHWLRKK